MIWVYTTKKIAPMQNFRWSNIRLPSLAEFRKISPMKKPQPKWWKNWIHRTSRLRKILSIIMLNSTANCCRLDRAYSLLKNFDSSFSFIKKVPSFGRTFSKWRQFIDGLRRKLAGDSLDTHCCFPFWKISENCGMTVSGSRSQSSMTVGRNEVWSSIWSCFNVSFMMFAWRRFMQKEFYE